MDEAKLWDLMNDAHDHMTFAQKRVWAAVRVRPQLWSNRPYKNAKFWVVGLIGGKAIWYEPNEHGFQLTPYQEFGQIGLASGNQFRLEEAVQHVINALEQGYPTAPIMSGPLPAEYEPGS